MNSKFNSLPEEKQAQIINAAFKVFAENSYKFAATSEIAQEAGISKSLLFHYFHNKLELYEYLWEICQRKVVEVNTKHKVYETRDFFEIFRRGLAAKVEIMEEYPCLLVFTINAFFEQDQELYKLIHSKMDIPDEKSAETFKQVIDLDIFKEGYTFEEIFYEIRNASEGMIFRYFKEGNLNSKNFEKEYLKMIEHWEKNYKR